MPESTSLPPKIMHEITPEDFLKAAKGEIFEYSEWFYRVMGRQMIETEQFLIDRDQVDPNRIYIVLREVKIVNHPLVLHKEYLPDDLQSFIIYKSIVEDIILMNHKSADWFFIDSTVASLILQESTIGKIIIDYGCEIRKIIVDESSNIESLVLANGSKVHTTYFNQESQSGDVIINETSQINVIHITGNSKAGNIMVGSESEGGIINIQDSSSAENITIHNNSKIKNIHVSGGSSCGYVEVYDTCIINEICIDTESICSSVLIRNNSYVSKISITSNGKCDSVIVDESVIESITVKGSETGNIHLQNRSYCQRIRIRKASKCDEVIVDSGCLMANISLSESVARAIRLRSNYGSLYLYNATVPLMHLKGCHIHELAWKAATKGELYIEESEINYLNLSKTLLSKESVVSLNNTKVYFARFQELLVHGQLILRHLKPLVKPFDWYAATNDHYEDESSGIIGAEKNKWEIHSWKKDLQGKQEKYYQGRLKMLDELIRGDEKPIFRIVDSSLSKTEITGSDLQDFIVEYRDSRLLELFISGTKLPKENIRIYEANEREYKQKASFYNQLKKAYENQGDIVDATVYHAKSMNYQQKLLLWNVRNGKESFLNKTELFFDYLGFLLNRLSNNHGESWLKASLFVLGVSVLFFLNSIWSLKYHFAFNLIFSLHGWQFLGDWEIIGRNIQKLPGYFLVTHPLDFLSKETGYIAGFWHFFWDIMGRIFIGYGIYQFITAFRRHGRKGG